VTRRLCALLALAGLVLALAAPGSAAPSREKWDTKVFAHVAAPGYPAYVFVHRNGLVYAGTYTNPAGDSSPSIVREWDRHGALLRSWTVPRQDLSQDHGVQVANQDRKGRLVLLEKSRSRLQTLDPSTGRFRTWAHFPDLPTCSTGASPCSPNVDDYPAIPNYATWGPGGALYVSDYGQAVIWKVPRTTHKPRVWFASSALDGTEFGTTGLVYRRSTHSLLVGQGSTAVDGSVPADGKLYELPIRRTGKPGHLSTLWTSQPADLPDGFSIGRSGHLYVACAGLSNQLVELSATGEELDRFPGTPGIGDNGSAIPFDTPSSATFLGERLLVANQSFTGDTGHHAILDVWADERGVRPYLPKHALWR
jgi:sugar lactone lactonase YvrE